MPDVLELTWITGPRRSDAGGRDDDARAEIRRRLGDSMVAEHTGRGGFRRICTRVEDAPDASEATVRAADALAGALAGLPSARRLHLVEVRAPSDPRHFELADPRADDRRIDGVCLYPDYSAHPSWSCPGGRNLDPGGLGIGASLRAQLDRWTDAFQGTDPDIPDGLHFPTLDEELAFEAEGRRLWGLMRRELRLPVAYREYRSGITIWDPAHLPLLSRGRRVVVQA